MSLLGRIAEKLAGGSSANLQKIKEEAEQRRASKSSARMQRVVVGGGVESTIASLLEKRIKDAPQPAAPKK